MSRFSSSNFNLTTDSDRKLIPTMSDERASAFSSPSFFTSGSSNRTVTVVSCFPSMLSQLRSECCLEKPTSDGTHLSCLGSYSLTSTHVISPTSCSHSRSCSPVTPFFGASSADGSSSSSSTAVDVGPATSGFQQPTNTNASTQSTLKRSGSTAQTQQNSKGTRQREGFNSEKRRPHSAGPCLQGFGTQLMKPRRREYNDELLLECLKMHNNSDNATLLPE